jgi:hypothetical protein
MPRVVFEPKSKVFERSKTISTLDRIAADLLYIFSA